MGGEVLGVEDGRHRLLGAEGQDVADGDAPGDALLLRDLVGLDPVDLAAVGEHEHEGVVGGGEHLGDDVAFLGLRPDDALAAAALGLVDRRLGPLDVARPRDGDHDVLVGDQVLVVDVAAVGDDLRAPGAGELSPDLQHLVLDQAAQLGRGLEDRAELGDGRPQLLGLLPQLLTLQRGEASQHHVEDRGRLDLREAEAPHQLSPGLVGRGRCPDQGDDLVEAVEGDEQALEDVHALLGLAKAELRAAGDDLHLVGDVGPQDVGDRQRARHPVDEGQHVHAERILKLRELVQVVEDHLRHGVTLELDDDAQPLAAGLVAAPADADDALCVDELLDLLQEPVARHHVRELGDDDASPALGLLDLGVAPDPHRAPARLVGIADPRPPEQVAAAREVGTLDEGEQLLAGDVGVVEHGDGGVDDLPQVVGRDVGGHAHRDAGRAVDEQVREAGRHYEGLALGAVVVGREVDGVLFDVPQQLHRKRAEATFGVVVHKAVGYESVGVAVHPDGVDGTDAGVLHRGHSGIEVRARHERLDDGDDLAGGDACPDVLAVEVPALDPVDVALLQPSQPATAGLRADVRRNERDVVGRHRRARKRHGRKRLVQGCPLRRQEADIALEQADVAAVADEDLVLAGGSPPLTAGYDTELEEEPLHIRGQPRAVGRVVDLATVPGQERHTAITLEEGLEKCPLQVQAAPPHEAGNALHSTLQPDHLTKWA